MRLHAAIAVGALGLALAAPARAEEPARPDPFARLDALLASGALMRGIVREDDVSLVFDHLRAAILAASQGREAPPPPEALTRRGEEIAAEAKVRGTAASAPARRLRGGRPPGRARRSRLPAAALKSLVTSQASRVAGGGGASVTIPALV
jgi:hypothetical protein